MPYVYILECNDGSYYVGSTWHLEQRVVEHDEGKGSRFTRRWGRRPVHLVWSQQYAYIDDAFAREKQIQGWSRAKRLALIEGREGDLPGLAASG